MRVIGTCSNCGGNVCVPSIWHSVYPPQPKCSGCGATAVSSLPVIRTRPDPRREPGTLGEYVGQGSVRDDRFISESDDGRSTWL